MSHMPSHAHTAAANTHAIGVDTAYTPTQYTARIPAFVPTIIQFNRFNVELDAMADIGPASNRTNEPLPTDEELLICLKALRGSKACGLDGVPVEIWRQADSARASLFTLIRKIIREEIVPDDMPLGELVMIFKNKGSSDDPRSFRPISLLNHSYKILAVWLLYRLQPECGSYIPENQGAFRSKRSCILHC